MTLDEQNNGVSWRDCNEVGLKHRWYARHSTGHNVYWGCRRCPVDTVTPVGGGVPKGVLR